MREKRSLFKARLQQGSGHNSNRVQTTITRYGRLLFALAIVAMASQYASRIFSFFAHSPEGDHLTIFFVIAVMFAMSFVMFHLANGTVLPSFVLAVIFGMAAKPLFAPVIEARAVLGALVGFGATLILFGGGLETAFDNFRKLFLKIFSISFLGLLLTAFLLSLFASWISGALGHPLSLPVCLLLGAVLASTDPAAIIPVIKRLRFHNRSLKDIIISESAVTDATGTLLTLAILSAIGSKLNIENVIGGYWTIFSAEIGLQLGRQLIFGILFGVCGYFLLETLTSLRTNHDREHEADSAFFLFIPIIIFTLALALGGSGYLAAFIAGLMFNLNESLHETERFFNHIIDGFFKPAIFLLLGAQVDLHQMFDFALIGIATSIVFMGIVRPLSVFISLGPFAFFGKGRPTLTDLLFISFIRETGAIPAVLLVTIVSMGLPDMEGLVAVGMWVILLTLLIEPPLTPWMAHKLKVAMAMSDDVDITIAEGPTVVLTTRGYSWVERLPKVVAWAKNHGVERILLLLCLENKYDLTVAHGIELSAQEKFAALNHDLCAAGHKPLNLAFLSRKGFLEQNIRELAKHEKHIVAIFVGRKMLDFRLAEIKMLPVPMYFIE